MTTLYDKRRDCQKETINYYLERAFTTGIIIGRYGNAINAWMERDDKNDIDISGGQIILTAKTRDSVIPALNIFGGKWEKELATWEEAIIEYSQTLRDEFGFSLLVVVKGAPPPSCEIIETEELVPASVRKVRRIKCPSPDKDDAPTVEPLTPEPEPTPEEPTDTRGLVEGIDEGARVAEQEALK